MEESHTKRNESEERKRRRRRRRRKKEGKRENVPVTYGLSLCCGVVGVVSVGGANWCGFFVNSLGSLRLTSSLGSSHR